MKAICLIFAALFSFQLLAFDFDMNQIDVEKVKELLAKNLPHEVFLKERIKLEGQGIPGEILKGEVRGHKVGNGFSAPGRVPRVEVINTCYVPGSPLEFIVLQHQSYQLYAVLTSDKEQANLAEFLTVDFMERTAGMRSYNYLVGTNPLRGEMFQLEWLKQNKGILRIVFKEKLHHFLVNCKR